MYISPILEGLARPILEARTPQAFRLSKTIYIERNKKLRELLKQKNFDYADDIWVSSDRRMGAADARGIFLPGGRKQVFRD